jgi:uncharacterized protein (TIGR00730 family)
MHVKQTKIRKFLSQKISQLNDIVADLDGLVTQMGFEFYRVCIFGSARIKPDTEDYNRVYKLAAALSEQGIDIVTGGGPGLMEAANRGAKAASKRSRSIGLPITLPFEGDSNSHLDVKYQHRRFSSRLDEFMRISHAVVVTPGGIGTILELMFTWQLLQVEHMQARPVILLGKDMWGGFLDWLKEVPLEQNLMNASDFDQIILVDSVEEVMQHLAPEIEKFKKTCIVEPAAEKSTMAAKKKK